MIEVKYKRRKQIDIQTSAIRQDPQIIISKKS